MISGIHLEALRLTADGLTSAAVARRLGIAEDTVKSRLKACRVKLGARTTTQAVSIAYTSGLFADGVLDALPCPRCQGTQEEPVAEPARCPKCAGPLGACVDCGKPARCGEPWCAKHSPDGDWSTPNGREGAP